MSNARDISDSGHQLVAWINFNGAQVTNPASTTGIRQSFGVSSVLDGGVGEYDVYFENAMPDLNYCVVAGQNATTMTTGQRTHQYYSESHYDYTTAFFQINCKTELGVVADTQSVNVAVFR